VISEDFSDGDFLFEVLLGPLDLGVNGSTVKLDFHDVCLLLSQVKLGELGVSDDSDDLTVLFDSGECLVGVFLALLVSPFGGVLGESLLFRLNPVLVESSLDFIGEVLSPDGGESSEAIGGLSVTDATNNFHCWSFDNGGTFDYVFLDELLALTSLVVSNDMSHAGFVTHEGGKVDWLLGIVLGEMSYSALVMDGSSLGHVTGVTLSGVFKLSVRHGCIFTIK